VFVSSGVGARSGFSILATPSLSDLQYIDNGQVFSVYAEQQQKKVIEISLFTQEGFAHNSNITIEIVNEFREFTNNSDTIIEDIFFYCYGVLHSPEYRRRFANNLAIQSPRVPLPRSIQFFENYTSAGKLLFDLHKNFQQVNPYQIHVKQGDLSLTTQDDPKAFFRVEKMKFALKGDRSSVIYNKNITIENIPLEAYEYVVNGKPALEWVMERQCVKTDKASGIVNDANDYANETMNNPAYPLELFQRVITVSLETMKIVKSLPKLDID